MILYKPGTKATFRGAEVTVMTVIISDGDKVSYLVRHAGESPTVARWCADNNLDVAADTPCWETEEITFKRMQSS
jgi:hypothetical protein